MASVKQIAANRRNAARGTGPKSAAGKQVARMNALKHGLQAAHVVIPGEDPEEFEALLRGLEEDYLPVGFRESLLVERIAECTWRLQRARLMETAIMRSEHFSKEKHKAEYEMRQIVDTYDQNSNQYHSWHGGSDDSEESDMADPYVAAARAYEKANKAHEIAEEELTKPLCNLAEVFQGSHRKLEKLSRYETSLERWLRNAMQDLERLQAARKSEAAEAATVIDISDMNREEA
jgi:hypothetical protein